MSCRFAFVVLSIIVTILTIFLLANFLAFCYVESMGLMQRRAARRKAYGTPPEGQEIVKIFHDFVVGGIIGLIGSIIIGLIFGLIFGT